MTRAFHARPPRPVGRTGPGAAARGARCLNMVYADSLTAPGFRLLGNPRQPRPWRSSAAVSPAWQPCPATSSCRRIPFSDLFEHLAAREGEGRRNLHRRGRLPPLLRHDRACAFERNWRGTGPLRRLPRRPAANALDVRLGTPRLPWAGSASASGCSRVQARESWGRPRSPRACAASQRGTSSSGISCTRMSSGRVAPPAWTRVRPRACTTLMISLLMPGRRGAGHEKSRARRGSPSLR